MTIVVQLERGVARIPDWVRDFASYRRWATSAEFPTRGWYAHLGGELWVDASLERVGHNLLRGQIARVLCTLADKDAGDHFIAGSRMLLTNVAARLCLEPDSMFFSRAALADGRVRLAHGEDSVEEPSTAVHA